MMQEIEGAQPTFVVVANLSGSWASPELSPMLQDWAQDYLNSEYEISGVVDILSHEETVYKWDQQASNYIPRSKYFLMIYKRQT